jgi:hypothetical protein
MNEPLVRYARVSTEQNELTAQRDGLHALEVGDDRTAMPEFGFCLETSRSCAAAGPVFSENCARSVVNSHALSSSVDHCAKTAAMTSSPKPPYHRRRLVRQPGASRRRSPCSLGGAVLL